MRRKVIIVALLLSPAIICYSQTIGEFQHHVSFALRNIERLHDSTDPQITYNPDHSTKSVWWPKGEYRDSLDVANQQLIDYFLKTLPLFSESLTIADTSIEGVNITTSANKKIRQWSWNTWMGGSMPDYAKILEVNTTTGIKAFNACQASPADLCNGTFTDIYDVTAKSGELYYVAVERWIGDGRHAGQTLRNFAIIGDSLKTNLNLFKTRKGSESEIYYYYPEDSVTWEFANAHSIQFTNDGRTVLIPLVTEQDKITSKFLRYEFDGEHFVYKGVSK
jgi:hypothetical protein